MAVLVTQRVGPVDWERFRAAVAWIHSQADPAWRSSKVYRSVEDPSMVLVVDEWVTAEAFNAFADRFGAEFNRRAGTEGLVWQDNLWLPSDASAR